MTTVAVMQPTYLPWLGYFDLMDQVDTFVLLDTVPFAYQSWQHRNRLPGPDEPTWLTVPVTKATRRGAILEVEVGDGGGWFPERHVNVLADRYGKVAQPELLAEVTELVRAGAGGRLVDLTVPLLGWLADRLGITTPVVAASALAAEGRRSDLVVALVEAVGGDRYVSPPGSVGYLAEDTAVYAEAGIEVVVAAYEHPVYDQGGSGGGGASGTGFQSHCSALDLVLRHPATAPAVARSGHRPPVPLAEVLALSGSPS